MPPLPEAIITVVGVFAPMFSRPVWIHAQVLLADTGIIGIDSFDFLFRSRC
jgi:hypothetical protein